MIYGSKHCEHFEKKTNEKTLIWSQTCINLQHSEHVFGYVGHCAHGWNIMEDRFTVGMQKYDPYLVM